jgi:hypothetical protein
MGNGSRWCGGTTRMGLKWGEGGGSAAAGQCLAGGEGADGSGGLVGNGGVGVSEWNGVAGVYRGRRVILEWMDEAMWGGVERVVLVAAATHTEAEVKSLLGKRNIPSLLSLPAATFMLKINMTASLPSTFLSDYQTTSSQCTSVSANLT